VASIAVTIWQNYLEVPIILDAEPQTDAPTLPQTWCVKPAYKLPPNFTGRIAERRTLDRWLNNPAQPVMIVQAMGGFGKSALAWYWLGKDVDRARWRAMVWWSFYESNASFESFLPAVLEYLGIDPKPLGPRQQVEKLIELLRQREVLLILDGFERALRAYNSMDAAYQGDELDAQAEQHIARDTINPLADELLRECATLPDMHSKLLLTTRLRPRALEVRGERLAGCAELPLHGLAPDDALGFFRKQGADAHLLLAELDLAAGKRTEARQHAAAARKLATCDGPLDYTYKVAYDEAGALLARLDSAA
jgi:hypothetical protein